MAPQKSSVDPFAESPAGVLYRAVGSLLNNSRYSDMTIRCGGEDFKVHRAVVCTQSPFFAKAMDGPFKEAQEGVVELPQDRPEILRLFLQFLYTGNYDDDLARYDPSVPSSALSVAVTAGMTAEDIDSELGQTPDKLGRPLSCDSSVDGENDADEHCELHEYEESHGENEEENSPESELEYNPESEEDISMTSNGTPPPPPEGYQDDEELERARERDVNSLRVSLRVYVMADKFDVPALRLLARERFWFRAHIMCKASIDFPSVVDELYATTGPGDPGMREIPSQLVADIYRWDGITAELYNPVMYKHSDFAVSILKYKELRSAKGTQG